MWPEAEALAVFREGRDCQMLAFGVYFSTVFNARSVPPYEALYPPNANT